MSGEFFVKVVIIVRCMSKIKGLGAEAEAHGWPIGIGP